MTVSCGWYEEKLNATKGGSLLESLQT